MAVYRAHCSWQVGSTAPRDQMVITPHFKATLFPSPDGLANDLATGLQTWAASHGVTRQLTVKFYNAEGAPPHYPVAEVIKNAGAVGELDFIREVAICLSFYADRNLPRQRGRLYVPYAMLASSFSGVGVRPSGSDLSKVAALVPIFTGLGGVDVDWCVYSKLDGEARSISHWWVDDEWDVQRRRGLMPSTRTEGNVSE